MHNSLLKIQLTYARGTTYNYRAWRYCHGLRDDPYQTLLAVGQAKGLISWLLKKIGPSGWVVLGIWIFRWLSRIAHQLSKYFTCRLFKHMYHAWTIVAYLMRRGVVDIVVVAADA